MCFIAFQMSCKGPELRVKPLLPPKPTQVPNHNPHNPHLQRIQSNCMMLDLRKQVQWQSQVIRDLKVERDRLTKELASRLFFVEAQLKREQKHIEALLNEKDQYIRFQDLQIESLKCVLSQVDWDYRRQQQCTNRGRSMSSSARRPSNKPPQQAPSPHLSKRYSVALDEYMKDNGIVSRAHPVVVQAEKECPPRSRCTRTLSLPELRFNNNNNMQEPLGPDQCYGPYSNFSQNHGISQGVIDELAARRWTSDCDSEHSDSLDSGISSPSIQSRSMHLEESHHSPVFADDHGIKSNNAPVRRGSSIGSFLNRKFSFSSNHLEKMKDDHHDGRSVCPTARRHGSFSGTNTNDIDQESGLHQRICEEQKPKKFISSANRTFGTNHRSVMKPRDIKFKKLFKFRRRTEPVDQDVIHCEDFMTV